MVADASLPHSQRIKNVVQMVSQLNSKSESVPWTEKDFNHEKQHMKSKQNLKTTNTSWKSQVAIIRKNHMIVERRRSKKLKRL